MRACLIRGLEVASEAGWQATTCWTMLHDASPAKGDVGADSGYSRFAQDVIRQPIPPFAEKNSLG